MTRQHLYYLGTGVFLFISKVGASSMGVGFSISPEDELIQKLSETNSFLET